MNRVCVVTAMLAIGLLAGLLYSNQHLRQQRDALRARNATLSQNLRIQQDLQIRANAIDSQRSKELTHAKNQIAVLERDVITGRRQLLINANCATAAGTGSVVDAGRARLTHTAERDYFILRERIETARGQIVGLQDYIKKVCLAK
ncbi:lysis protein [Gibbsiella quercinecans]|uniref:lysis protein n=1 Tax=Gibbsiella quercinecans TaxID=929813 RepID=UPI003A4D3C4E